MEPGKTIEENSRWIYLEGNFRYITWGIQLPLPLWYKGVESLKMRTH